MEIKTQSASIIMRREGAKLSL